MLAISSKGPADKVKRMMGAQLPDLLTQCVERKGRMLWSEYTMMWQLINGKGITEFLYETLRKLQDEIVTLEEQEKQGKPLQVTLLHALLNAAYFCFLFLAPSRRELRLKTVSEALKKNVDDVIKRSPNLIPNTLDCCRDVMQQLCTQEDYIDISAVLHKCTQLCKPDELKLISDRRVTSFSDQSYFQTATMLYPWLMLSLGNNKELIPDMLKNLASLLRGKLLTEGLRSQPREAELSLLAVLHILRALLVLQPVTDAALIKELLGAVKYFHLWPLPYGKVALDVLYELRAEWLLPGSCRRLAFERECRTACIEGFDDSFGQKARPVYHFIDANSENGLTFAQIAQLRPIRQPNEEQKLAPAKKANGVTLSATTKLRLILQTIATELCASVDKTVFRGASSLNEKAVDELYRLYTDVVRAVMESKPSSAPALRRKALTTLYQRVQEYVASAQGPGVFDGDSSEGVLPLPPLMHLACIVPSNYAFLSREEIQLSCLSYLPFPSTDALAFLDSMLQGYACDESRPVDLRVVLAGGNETLHAFVCSWLALVQANPEKVHGVNLKLFLLPVDRNDVSSFLARHDAWYNRHVYLPFRTTPFLVPWVKPDSQLRNSDEMQTPPGVLLRLLVESYVREASVSIPFLVYQCTVWLKDPGSDSKGDDSRPPDQVIPFLQRVEVGYPADARQFLVTKEMSSDAKATELKDAGFRFNPPEIKVSLTTADMRGQPQAEIVDDAAAYTSLTIINVPRQSDGVAANPCTPWLEFIARPTDAAAAKASKQKLRKHVLLTEGQQHILSVRLATAEQPFMIRVDGVLFGPYAKVCIEPLMLPHDKSKELVQACFPIQSFFPNDL